jgi:hypothetical protein
VNGTRYCGVPAHQALVGQEPPEVPAAAVEEVATPEEAEELEPVAEVEASGEAEAEPADEADAVRDQDEAIAADRQEDETPA